MKLTKGKMIVLMVLFSIMLIGCGYPKYECTIEKDKENPEVMDHIDCEKVYYNETL